MPPSVIDMQRNIYLSHTKWNWLCYRELHWYGE